MSVSCKASDLGAGTILAMRLWACLASNSPSLPLALVTPIRQWTMHISSGEVGVVRQNVGCGSCCSLDISQPFQVVAVLGGACWRLLKGGLVLDLVLADGLLEDDRELGLGL